jgi:hypothetical protein
VPAAVQADMLRTLARLRDTAAADGAPSADGSSDVDGSVFDWRERPRAVCPPRPTADAAVQTGVRARPVRRQAGV